MIFYKNLKKFKKIKEKNLVFSIFADGIVSNVDDSISKPIECKECYNLNFRDGALKTGMGFKDIEVPASIDNLHDCHSFNFAEKVDDIKSIWVDRWFDTDRKTYMYQLVMIDSKNVLWGIPLIDAYNGLVWLKYDQLKSFPISQCQYRIENTDCSLFFTENGMACLSSLTEEMCPNVPPLISSVVHYNKFFGVTNTNRNTLIYTKNLNLKTWANEESSTIEFLDNRGAFNKLVAFNDYVYLFREYGITKISIYSAKDDFSFTHIYTSTSKIFEESICVCGDNVLFMTRDGLYSFNGNSVSKIESNGNDLFLKLDNSHCSSACLNGKYYLATRCNFDDSNSIGCESSSFVNNVLFEIDLEDYHLNIYRGVDIRKILNVDNPYMSKLCACFNNLNKQRVGELTFEGKTFDTVNLKSWKSFFTDLGVKAKRKRIKDIVINTLYDCSVEIISDEESKIYNFSGSPDEQKLSVSVYGKNFQFVFKTNQTLCEIKKPMIIFDVVS